jgi:hypothetical protein
VRPRGGSRQARRNTLLTGSTSETRPVFGSVRELLRFLAWLRAEQEDPWERRLRHAVRWHRCPPEIAAAYAASLHPPGLRYPLSERKSRKRRRRERKRSGELARRYLEV